MKKLMAAALALMMFSPTGVQAKGTTVDVVTQIGKRKVTYNKDGLITNTGYVKMQYKNGKIKTVDCTDGTFHVTYQKGRIATINKEKVKVAYKSIQYTDEKWKTQTSPKGTVYSFRQHGIFNDDAKFLFNKKGQLLVSYLGFMDCFYHYDAKGYMVKGCEFDLTTGVGPNYYTSRNTYKGNRLTSRVVKGTYDSNYTNHEKITYKRMRVRDVNAVKKQQKILLNNNESIAFIF
ncbi:MAG: hypothetical protein ACI32Q_06050 [Intestinibaculum porci]|uniref:hypothetical protein n=1 Tax=Intestinibaculum porci TaxID=2487118 RepID=UPI003F0B2974